MEQSSKKLATSYGVYLGIALLLFTVLVYAIDLSMFTQWYMMFIPFIIILVLAIMAVKKAKIFSNHLFTFKDAFGTYFLTVFIGLLISSIFSFVLFSLIDPQAAETVKELTIETQVEMMEGFGVPESEINKAIEKTQNENSFSLKNIAIGFAVQLAVYSVIGLIIALIFREKEQTH